jgi:hypothetical protein
MAFLVAMLAAVTACANESEPSGTPWATPSSVPASSPNYFLNPGLEEGEGPWFSLTTSAWGTPFRLSEAAAHSGQHSALLEMRASREAAGTTVFGLVQEVSPKDFPEVLSGYYRVENWKRGTSKQYLQFAVIVWQADNLPGGYENHQIRYPLAGISAPPFLLRNAKFIFTNTEEPVSDQWVYFERNLRQDFQEVWGAVPEGFSKIRVLFEVRYDGKAAGSGEVKADVYYDDLYIGPADENPNTAQN